MNGVKMGNKKTAFSVAEAMMALLIGSVALGAAAPMITKQIKQLSETTKPCVKVLAIKKDNKTATCN